MKTRLLIFWLSLSGLTTYAQPQAKWGLQAGVSICQLAASGSDFSDIRTEQHPVTGFQAGLLAEIHFTNVLLLRTGLQVQRRGFAFEISQSGIHYEALYQPYYLHIPAIVALTNGHLHAGAGAYFAYGLGGNYHSEWEAPGLLIQLPDAQDRKLKWGNNAEEDDFSRQDAGLQFEAGLTVRRWCLSGAYALGLANVQPHPDAAGVTKKNRTLTLSLSCFLGRY